MERMKQLTVGAEWISTANLLWQFYVYINRVSGDFTTKLVKSYDIMHIYIYIYRERERERYTKVSACNAFFAAALRRWQKYIQFIFCCSAAISLTGDNNQCHITGIFYYQIAAAQWRMVHFGTPRVGAIHTPNIGPIDEGLISISVMESHP